jgi:hypothetical protein
MSFPMMLAASLALHVAVIGGVALYYFCGATEKTLASSEPVKATVTLIRSMEAHAVSRSQPVANKSSTPAFVSASIATPLLPAPAPSVPASAPLAQASHEANPNAHVQALPPEAILSPVPPPILNSANGVVFILDVSGSMYEPYAGSTRLAFAREALAERIRALKDGTPFAITLYAQRTLASGPLVAANDATRDAAVRFIQRDVDCGGGTNLPAGFSAAERLHPGAIVLASDGDLNISASNLEALAGGILGEKDRCPHLEIIGIAPRTDAGDGVLLENLADRQGGIYEIETASPAQLVSSAANATKPSAATPQIFPATSDSRRQYQMILPSSWPILKSSRTDAGAFASISRTFLRFSVGVLATLKYQFTSGILNDSTCDFVTVNPASTHHFRQTFGVMKRTWLGSRRRSSVSIQSWASTWSSGTVLSMSTR